MAWQPGGKTEAVWRYAHAVNALSTSSQPNHLRNGKKIGGACESGTLTKTSCIRHSSKVARMWTLHLAIETRYYAHEDILSFAKLQPAQ